MKYQTNIRLDQGRNDRFGRGQIGIANPEVDDVGPARNRFGLKLIDGHEHIGRQLLQSLGNFNRH